MRSRVFSKAVLVVGTILFFTLLSPLTVVAQPTFAPAVTYDSAGVYAYSVAVADVNRDGKPDLIVGNNCGGGGHCTGGPQGALPVSVLLGNGDGTFKTAVTYGSGGYSVTSVAVADVNGDGNPDLLVTNACASLSNCIGTIGVLLGNGDGTFKTAITYGSGGVGAFSVAVADVNADLRPDLVVANFCGSSNCAMNGTVGVLLGNGDGTFNMASIYPSGEGRPQSVAVADVNGDRMPDIMVANSCASGSTCTNAGEGVLLGNGDGTFKTVVTYAPGGYYAYSSAAADVNGDGKPDLIVATCADSNCANGLVGVLFGNGDGTFQTAVTYGSGGLGGHSVVVADVNGDGKPDVLVANLLSGVNGGNGTVGVLLGNGDGTFKTAVTYGSGGYQSESVAVADVNGDGKPDVLVTNLCPIDNGACGNYLVNGTVGVLINTSAPVDTTLPVITVSANPTTLWPPNGEMVRVTISGAITDTGSGVNVRSAAYAVGDEYGQVQPTGSIAVGSGGRYSFIILLQASRAESDHDGRRYTVTVTAKDNAANLGSASIVVTVPHDQRN